MIVDKSSSHSMHVSIPTVTDFSSQVNISDPVFGGSNVTVNVTIQQDEHSNLSSFVFALVMYNISFSSTIEMDVEEHVQRTKSFALRIILPYNMEVNMSIVPTLCGQTAREVSFNFSFYYS